MKSLIFIKLKKLIYLIKGYKMTNVNIDISKKWLGSLYGGFYLHTNKINSNSIIYSLGIGQDITFDSRVMDLFNCQVYAFDPTPKSVNWVKKNVFNKNFKFIPNGISKSSGVKKFYKPKNQLHVSGSLYDSHAVNKYDYENLNFITLIDAMKEHDHQNINVLKMDVEGAEYEIIEYIKENNIQIDQILVEFHSLIIENGDSKTKKAIQTLNEMGYKCFGISESFQEYSFIKL